MRMNSVLPAALFLAWFIRRAAPHHDIVIPANPAGSVVI